MELRKRKGPSDAPRPAVAPKKPRQSKGASNKKLDPPSALPAEQGNGQKEALAEGQSIKLEGFGGEVQTQDGATVTLESLVADSESGVVLFTYPRASTPGCTKQACLFRDGYEKLSSTGLSIFGLSADSTKANTSFKTKQNLPYALLCDPGSTLISAIGLKKTPKGTVRGVFAVDKSGKILLCQAGSPASTFEAVEKLLSKPS